MTYRRKSQLRTKMLCAWWWWFAVGMFKMILPLTCPTMIFSKKRKTSESSKTFIKAFKRNITIENWRKLLLNSEVSFWWCSWKKISLKWVEFVSTSCLVRIKLSGDCRWLFLTLQWYYYCYLLLKDITLNNWFSFFDWSVQPLSIWNLIILDLALLLIIYG